jgi:hypothetical protein
MHVVRVVESFEEASRRLAACNEISFDQSDLDSLAASISQLETRLQDVKKLCDDHGLELDARLELAYRQRDALSELSTLERHKATARVASTTGKAAAGPAAPPEQTGGTTRNTGSTGNTRDTIPAIHDTSGLVRHEEFAGVSSYMRGRLTVEKINNAILELTRHATQNRDMVRAVRKGATATAKHMDRKHALWLNQHIVPAVKDSGSKFFVVDQDLKRGTHLPAGSNSSRAILTILRHLGRVTETRLTVDGKAHVIYSLLYL